jgi:hypothetical protein
VKISSFPLCLILLIAGSTFAFGAAKSTDPALSPPGPYATPDKSGPKWSVTVSVLMVAMPQEKMLPMIPDLRDPKKIDGAVDQLLAAVQNKEAILIGYPIVVTVDGERTVSESTIEERYPTEFDPAMANCPISGPHASPTPSTSGTEHLVDDSPIPTAFETRNVGVDLEVDAHVINHGESIRLENLVMQRVALLDFLTYRNYKIDQPRFAREHVETEMTVQNGQQILAGIHLIQKPENYMEVFILQASDTPVK